MVLQSILEHGQLMKSGDTLFDKENQIQAEKIREAEAEQTALDAAEAALEAAAEKKAVDAAEAVLEAKQSGDGETIAAAQVALTDARRGTKKWRKRKWFYTSPTIGYAHIIYTHAQSQSLSQTHLKNPNHFLQPTIIHRHTASTIYHSPSFALHKIVVIRTKLPVSDMLVSSFTPNL